jgi:hypothetical protein
VSWSLAQSSPPRAQIKESKESESESQGPDQIKESESEADGVSEVQVCARDLREIESEDPTPEVLATVLIQVGIALDLLILCMQIMCVWKIFVCLYVAEDPKSKVLATVLIQVGAAHCVYAKHVCMNVCMCHKTLKPKCLALCSYR